MMQFIQSRARTIALLGGAILIIGFLALSGTTTKNDVLPGAEERTAVEPAPSAATQAKEQSRTAAPKPAPTTVVAPGSSLPSRTAEGLYIISYTNRGFEPATLQIAQREGVRFINRSDKAMRIFALEENDQVYGTLSQSKSVGK